MSEVSGTAALADPKKMPPAVAPAEGVETPNIQEGISMATVLEKSNHSPEAGTRPTREQCIQEAGAVLARALQLYVPASAVQVEAA